LDLDEFWVPRGKKDSFNLKNTYALWNLDKLPENSLFIHQDVMELVLTKKKRLHNETRVYFTHNNRDLSEVPHIISVIGKASRVFTQNKQAVDFLESNGLPKGLASPIYGAIDRNIFFPKLESKETIGIGKEKLLQELPLKEFVLIVGDCKERKNPKAIFDVVKANPSVFFVIHGRGWERMTQAQGLKNLKIIQFNFSLHPFLMRNAQTYLSLSILEGGPYPTIEAMASGTPVLVTDTGWNKELVSKEAGFVIPTDSDHSFVSNYLYQALEMKKFVQSSDLLKGRLTWKDMGYNLYC